MQQVHTERMTGDRQPSGGASDISGNPIQHLTLCAWLGLIMVPLTAMFWGVMGQNIPPYSANLPAEVFVAEIRAHAYTIRAGMVLTMLISALYAVWGVALWKLMQQVERRGNILSTLQLVGAVLTTVVFMLPCAVWAAVTYRTETVDPATIQLLYDFGWFFFDCTYSVTTLQFVAFGACMLGDDRAQPLMPAWVCWVMMCVSISFVAESAMPFFYDGPFARNGIINYWIELGGFFNAWLISAIYVVIAARRLSKEQATAYVRG